MNKFQFITHLMDTRKFSPSQKERFFKLVGTELATVEDQDKKILEDIRLIKERIGMEGKKLSIGSFSAFNDSRQEGYDEFWTAMAEASNISFSEPKGKKAHSDTIKGETREGLKILLGTQIDRPKSTDLSNENKQSEKPENIGSVDSDINQGKRTNPLLVNYNLPAKGENKNKENEKEKDVVLSDATLLDVVEQNNNESSININIIDDDSDVFPKYYYPKSLYIFLFNYNQNKILKSTCHDIDSDELANILAYCNTENYNFNKHLEKIIEAYEIHEKKYFAPTNLKTLFRVYLTGKNYKGEVLNGWTSDVIKINWSCEDLKKWSEGNPGIPPSPSDGIIEENENTGFEFNRIESKLTGQYLQSFSQLVIHFKHLFHIRSDNSLRSIINRKNDVEQWNDKIDFIIDDNLFPSNIEHFTDIDKLIQAYKRVILLALEIAEKHKLEKPKIKLSASVDLEKLEFSIHHLNTEYQKSIANTLERLGQSYGHLIRNQINGLCELYLKADFGQNNFAQINLWNGKPRKSEPIVSDDFTGVEHLFIFPKK